MKSLLNALQEGRLIELPDNNKDKALQYLATLIEAIPDLKAGTEVAEGVLARERAFNTGIGKGWGCPHVRTPQDGELICAIGWSPAGIDYGSSDGAPVHIVVMYYVPDCQKNAYLKEISTLARAIQSLPELQDFKSLQDLSEARHRLLDIISAAVESYIPEAKARMIRLEARQAAVAAATEPSPQILPFDLSRDIFSLTVLVVPGVKTIILAQDKELVAHLEAAHDLPSQLTKQLAFDLSGYRVMPRSATTYQPDRLLYDCIAIKVNGIAPTPATTG